MAHIKLNIQRCKGCELCVKVCPVKNIEMSQELNASGVHHAHIVDHVKCSKCGLCYHMCPDLVIEIEK